MSNRTNTQIEESLGFPASGVNLAPLVLSVSNSTASGVLSANTTYRLAATEDLHFFLHGNSFPDGGGQDNRAASTSDTLLFGGVPEVFTTDTNNTVISAIRASADGTLICTPMKTRKN